MALATHSTAAFRVLVRAWAHARAAHSEHPAPTIVAAVAAGFEVRHTHGTVADAAHRAGVGRKTLEAWLRAFARDLDDAARDAGWTSAAVLFCDLAEHAVETEDDARPRVAGLLASSGFALALARVACGPRSTAPGRRAAVAVVAGLGTLHAAARFGAATSTVADAAGRLRDALEAALALGGGRDAWAGALIAEGMRSVRDAGTGLGDLGAGCHDSVAGAVNRGPGSCVGSGNGTGGNG